MVLAFIESALRPSVFRTSSGNFAILTAIRRASSLVSSFADERLPGSSSK
jgi:hypothetical protein